MRPSVCVDCRLALPHAALGLIAIRGILGCPERWPHRNTSGRWFPAPALELAGVPPLNGVAILVDRSRPRDLVSLNRRDVALPARLVEAVDPRWALGSCSARGLLYSWGSQETGRRGLGLPPDHARPRRRTGIPGRVSVLVEPLAGAEFGWGLIVTAILFAGSNGLVDVDPQLHARIVLHAAIAPFLMSLVSGWIRERTDSVWPSVFGHNLSNIVIPFASLFA